LRVFVGGTRSPQATSWSDEELVNTSLNALRELLQISGEPTLIDICRYPAAIPQFYLGHVEKIARLRETVSAIPGLHLAGNYLDGVSINDCVRLAKTVASDVITEILRGNTHESGRARIAASTTPTAAIAP
jgi:oxygen-dependent protoporphyrinogen oxidase